MPRGAADGDVRSGELRGGLPVLTLGRGAPLVILPGLEPRNRNPTGPALALELRRWRPWARHFRVHVVRRAPGVPPGCTVADLAGALAAALETELGDAVDVLGISTGGSVALQLAVDHPGRVRRLVLLASACRLSDAGRAMQRRQAELLAAGEHRRAWAVTAPALATSSVGRRLAAAALWLTGPRLSPDDVRDLLRTIEAEDRFDVTDELARVTAPTLVIGGDRDPYYTPDLFRRTADGVRDGRLRLSPGKGHGGTVLSGRARTEAVRFLAGNT